MIPQHRRNPEKLRHRPFRLLTLLGSVAGLMGCTPTINANIVSSQLQTVLQEQGITVKAVDCPQNVLVPPYLQADDSGMGDAEPLADPGADVSGADVAGAPSDPTDGSGTLPVDPTVPDPNATPSDQPPPMLTLVESLHRPFACTGELEPEGGFPILVSRRTEQGQVQWAVPNSREMLSMQELSNEIGAAIAQTTGSPPTLDCGTGFRINRPGTSFECSASGSAPIEDSGRQYTLVSVRVNTDPTGNISWQQVRQADGAAPLPPNPDTTGNVLPPLDGTPPPITDGTTPSPAATDPTFNTEPFTSGPSITDDPGAAVTP